MFGHVTNSRVINLLWILEHILKLYLQKAGVSPTCAIAVSLFVCNMSLLNIVIGTVPLFSDILVPCKIYVKAFFKLACRLSCTFVTAVEKYFTHLDTKTLHFARVYKYMDLNGDLN